MDEFLEKWKNDKKFKSLIQLIVYSLFVIIISIYAISSNNKQLTEEDQNIQPIKEENTIITIPKNYKYNIKIMINENEYIYNGEVLNNQEKINKISEDITTSYIYENDKYYLNENDEYILTTKEEVYGNINKNYIDLNSINNYLNHGIKEGNQYIIYLKDIILNEESDEYIVILINKNIINIDYTPLIKTFNQEITNYQVKIEYEEIKL